MSTYSGCGCTSEDCRVNGCLSKREQKGTGGFYAVDSADCGHRDDVRALQAERDALRKALETMVEMVEMNGLGRAYAMKVARAALAQAPRACTCHPDDRPDGPCCERYAASECQARAALAQGQGGNHDVR